MNDEDADTIEAMIAHGGSFVVALARLARVADDENLAKIKSTWSGYWRKYAVVPASDGYLSPNAVARGIYDQDRFEKLWADAHSGDESVS